MSLQHRFSFVVLLLFFLFLSADAAHGLPPPHVHRPFAFRKVHRRIDVSVSLPGQVSSIVNAIVSPDPGGTSSQPSTSAPSSTPPLSTNPPTTDSPASTNSLAQTTAPSSAPSAVNPSSSLPLSSDPGSSSPTSGPVSSQPPTSSAASSPLTNNVASSSPQTSSPVSSPPLTSNPISSLPLTSNPISSLPLTSDLSSSLPLTNNPTSSPPPASSSASAPPVSSSASSQLPTSNPLSSPPSSSVPAPTSSPAFTTPQSSPTPSSSSTPPSSAVNCLGTLDLLGNCILGLSSSAPVSSSPLSPASSAAPSTSVPSSPPQSSALPTSLPLTSVPQSSLSPSSQSPPVPLSSVPVSSPVICDPGLATINGVCAASSPLDSSTGVPSPSIGPTTISQPAPTSPAQTVNPSSSLAPSSPASIPSAGSTPPASSTPIPSHSFSLSQPLPTSQPPLFSSSGGSSQPSLTLPFSTAPPSTTSPFEACGPDGIALGMCSSASRTPTPSTPGTLSSGGSAPSLPPTSSPSQESGASSILNQLTSGTLTGGSTTGSEGASTTGALSGTNSGSLSASPSPPVISFPSGSPNAVSQTTDVPLTAFTRSSSLPPVNSQFSYITIFSLLGVSVQTSPIPSSMTDPDAPTTTLSLIAPSSSLTGQVTPVPLPSDLPARIYPVNQIGNLPGGYTLCSILFDSSLPWDFVASNTQSQGQIFAWTQVLIMNALNISTSETPPYALQVFVPATYVNASDSSLLLTQYLFLLSADLVATLADQIKVPSSAFYDAGEPYVELAKHINPAYGLTSVPDPSAIPGSSSGAVSHGDKSRTDTIIGVVGGLGGLAFIILGVLIFNGVKRSRELRHRRLSDPNLPNDPYPDRTGRDFDQDSVGGQRRRSFYFAEDSLRGQQQQSVEQSTVPVAQAQTQYVVQPGSQVEYSHRTSPESMRERRGPVLPGAISAPILTQSSLNW